MSTLVSRLVSAVFPSASVLAALLAALVGCGATRAPARARATTVSSASAALPDQAPADLVDATIATRTHAIRACYAEARANARDVRGKVTVFFRIAPTGAVSWAREAHDGEPHPATAAARSEPSFPDRGVVECVVSEFRGLSFPPARNETLVVYPLVFD